MALLEREEQLRAATEYLADAAAGQRAAGLRWWRGRGSAKTTLLDRFASGAIAHVATGWCDRSATPPPRGPLVDMLPELPDGVCPEGAGRSQVFANLLTILRAARAKRDRRPAHYS
jgi:hypothetical protein